jgi:hypothetical protein
MSWRIAVEAIWLVPELRFRRSPAAAPERVQRERDHSSV